MGAFRAFEGPLMALPSHVCTAGLALALVLALAAEIHFKILLNAFEKPLKALLYSF